MIEWNKYIEWGKFISTHGIELPYKWEFDRLENEERDKEIIISSILGFSYPYTLVGIHTIHPNELEKKYCSSIYYPKTNILELRYGHNIIKDYEGYIIYDDVITTGRTILKCIDKIGRTPRKIICIIDRRQEVINKLSFEEKTLKITSIERDILK